MHRYTQETDNINTDYLQTVQIITNKNNDKQRHITSQQKRNKQVDRTNKQVDFTRNKNKKKTKQI